MQTPDNQSPQPSQNLAETWPDAALEPTLTAARQVNENKRLAELGVSLIPIAYRIKGLADVRIEASKQRDGSELWAARRHGSCLAKDGEWEWEPQPSSRDDGFIERCRWGSPEEAAEAVLRLTVSVASGAEAYIEPSRSAACSADRTHTAIDGTKS